MNQKFYPLRASENFLSFQFESQSEERTIAKAVELVRIGVNVYNLAFGDLAEHGDLNDQVVSNNGDMHKILATVAQAIILFFKAYPGEQVYFTGSSPARTRLYGAILNRERENWSMVFEVKVVLNGEPIPFKSSSDYDGFLVSGKK